MECRPQNPESKADYYSFSYSVYLKSIDHASLKLFIFLGILQIKRFEFPKFRILEILNFDPFKHISLNCVTYAEY